MTRSRPHRRWATPLLSGAAAIAGSFLLASPAAALPDPNAGPGGPILVVTGDSNPFGRYYAEILRNEGLNEFDVANLSAVTPAALDARDVVVLGETPLSATEVTMFTDWVQDGGNLIAMRPDDQLAGLLGLTGTGATLADAYLEVDDSSPPGAGIVDETIQFHGVADRYSLSGATSVATLYSDATTATTNPAVTLRSVGANGGQAAAFTYDLARSIVYTRQGNPAWAGQERDGISPLRPDDLFFGNDVDDPQPDWVDLDKVEIPQADEQQRLLANLIGHMNLDRKPLPRFWYLPRGEKAAIVMTGDDHGSGNTAGRLDLEQDPGLSPPGCSVADWECVRSTSYIYPGTPLSDAQADAYEADGFEIALHPDTGCASLNASDYGDVLTTQLASFAASFPSLSDPVTNRNHCIAWSDWAVVPQVELDHGIRLDTNYYYWPPGWVQDRPGMFTGSGMPMRFADLDGSMIDVYQAATQMTDESGQTFPFTSDALLDKALGPEGYYGAFTANMHTDSAFHAGWAAIVGSAQSRGVPIVSSRQMLEWIDGRNDSSFGSIAWNAGTLSFTVDPAAGVNGLRAMVPTQSAAGALSGVERDGNPVATTTETIKGVEYAFVEALAGSYEATYAPDVTPPAISAVSAVAGPGGTATVTWQTDEPADSRVDYGTDAGALGSSETESALVTSHSVELTGLDPGTTYHYRVTSSDAASNSATEPDAPAAPATFATPSATFVDTTHADFGAGTPTGTHVSEHGGGEVILQPTVVEEFSGAGLPAGWSDHVWTPGGAATVSGGSLTVDGARAGTDATFGAGRSLEFVATFNGNAFQHVGFGVDYNDFPWAMFSVRGDGSLAARTHNGGSTETTLSSSLLGSPHRYRIDWNATSVEYRVDDALVATHGVSFGATQMRPLASDFNAGGGGVSIDWLRMTPYASSGTFTSRVFDAGNVAEWDALTWAADTPVGTTVALSVRTGDTPTPDGTWSAFTPVAASGDDIPGSTRYVQYRADFATSDPDETSVLRDVTIAYHHDPVANDDTETVDEDSGANTLDVRGNDTDADGGPKTIVSTTDPANGTVAITNSGADLAYTPDPDYCNTNASPPGDGPDDTFTYTLNGGSTATVSVAVTCVDDDPTAIDDSRTVDEDSGANPFDVLANDLNADGGPKTITAKTNGANGAVAITGGGTGLTYTPNPDYCNTDPSGPGSGPDDTFTYTLNGGSTATVSVAVTCLPDGGDTTKPTITINRPYEGARYSRFADPKPELTADYECADADSGIASCTGTVADGAPFDRATVGIKTFTVTATDNAGNTHSESVTYRVFTFRNLIANDSPIAYYRLGDAASSQTMAAVVGPNGEYKNGQQSVPFGISGDGDRARRFTGQDGYGYANGIQAPRSYTLSTFVRFDDTNPAMVAQHGGAGAIWQQARRIRFRPVDWHSVELTSGVNSISANTWYHVAATYDWVPSWSNPQLGTGTAKLYLNGSLVDTDTADKQTSGSSTFYVGYGDKAPWLRGVLDEVAYFPTALSGTHVHEIWLADPPPAEDVTAEPPADPASDPPPASADPAPASEEETPAGEDNAGTVERLGLRIGDRAELSGRSLTITLDCDDDCAGMVSARRGKTRLGTRDFEIAAGESGFVRIKLAKRGLRALRGKRGAVTITVTGTGEPDLSQRTRLAR